MRLSCHEFLYNAAKLLKKKLTLTQPLFVVYQYIIHSDTYPNHYQPVDEHNVCGFVRMEADIINLDRRIVRKIQSLHKLGPFTNDKNEYGMYGLIVFSNNGEDSLNSTSSSSSSANTPQKEATTSSSSANTPFSKKNKKEKLTDKDPYHGVENLNDVVLPNGWEKIFTTHKHLIDKAIKQRKIFFRWRELMYDPTKQHLIEKEGFENYTDDAFFDFIRDEILEPLYEAVGFGDDDCLTVRRARLRDEVYDVLDTTIEDEETDYVDNEPTPMPKSSLFNDKNQ